MINELKQGLFDKVNKTISLITSEFPAANPVAVKNYVMIHWDMANNHPNNPNCFFDVNNIVAKFSAEFGKQYKTEN